MEKKRESISIAHHHPLYPHLLDGVASLSIDDLTIIAHQKEEELENISMPGDGYIYVPYYIFDNLLASISVDKTAMILILLAQGYETYSNALFGRYVDNPEGIRENTRNLCAKDFTPKTGERFIFLDSDGVMGNTGADGIFYHFDESRDSLSQLLDGKTSIALISGKRLGEGVFEKRRQHFESYISDSRISDCMTYESPKIQHFLEYRPGRGFDILYLLYVMGLYKYPYAIVDDDVDDIRSPVFSKLLDPTRVIETRHLDDKHISPISRALERPTMNAEQSSTIHALHEKGLMGDEAQRACISHLYSNQNSAR